MSQTSPRTYEGRGRDVSLYLRVVVGGTRIKEVAQQGMISRFIRPGTNRQDEILGLYPTEKRSYKNPNLVSNRRITRTSSGISGRI